VQAVTRVNAEQASKRVTRKPTRLFNGEGRRRWHPAWPGPLGKSDADQRFRRGSGDGMHAQGDGTQHGKPDAVEARDFQPDAGDGQAGLYRVAERPVVPWKPGNAGGGKGPWFKVNAGSSESREIGDEPTTSREGSEVTGGVARQSEGITHVALLRPV